MPIKFSKGFTRRKSSGNVLEDVAQPVEPSFRVLDRRERESHVFGDDTGGVRSKSQQQLRTPSSQPGSSMQRPVSAAGDGRENSPDDSVGRQTYNSTSTNGGVSSTRFSNGSTLPSSVENSQNDLLNMKGKSSNALQVDPLSRSPNGSSRTASIPKLDSVQSDAESPRSAKSPTRKRPKSKKGKKEKEKEKEDDGASERLFSFGRKVSHASKNQTPEEEPLPEIPSYIANISPPKLDLSTDVQSDDRGFEGGLAYIISSLGKRTSTIMEEPQSSPPAPQQGITRTTSDYTYSSGYSNNMERTGSRRSWDSQRSQEAFSTSQLLKAKASNLSSRHGTHLEGTEEEDDDGNADLFDVVYASQNLASRFGPAHQNSVLNRPRMNNDLWIQPQNTIRSQYSFGSNEPRYNARNNYRQHNATTLQGPAPPRTAGKVLSPAEFEKLKQKARDGPPEDDESEDSEESENYDDEDDMEREKKIVHMRRRQEANLAVYRQQMMKVTGDSHGELPTQTTVKRPTARMGLERSTVSAPNFGEFNINSAKRPGEVQQQEKASDESDEDVPLGVLQAHGFPSRNRPPNKPYGSAGEKPFIRPASQMSLHPTPLPATQSSMGASGNGLPALVRNSSSDPYIGAGIVNPSNRESLHHANTGAGAAATAQAAAGGPLPPGGLVGVIAGEERARAMRRGSPNQAGSYNPMTSPAAQGQTMPQQYQMNPNSHLGVGMNPAMGGMPMDMQQQMMMAAQGGPSEQAQFQMSAQMTQMMQMQMQWMQQMQQMMQQQQQQQQAQPYGLPGGSMSMNNLLQRPRSSASMGRPLGHDRAQSSLSMSRPTVYSNSNTLSVNGGRPSMSGAQSVSGLQMHGQAYAASIAPSERSNIGQPSRYRPVSIAPSPGRTSRMSSMALNNSNDHNLSRASPGPGLSSRQSSELLGRGSIQKSKSSDALRSSSAASLLPTIKVLNKPKFGGGNGGNSSRRQSAIEDHQDDDDDDEEGWEEIRKKRIARKSKWSQTSLSAIAASSRASSRPASSASSVTAAATGGGVSNNKPAATEVARAPSPMAPASFHARTPTPSKLSGLVLSAAAAAAPAEQQDAHPHHDNDNGNDDDSSAQFDLPEALYYDHTGFTHHGEDDEE